MPDNPLITPMSDQLVWMGTKPPMSPTEAASALYGMTGIPDLVEAHNSLQRGEYLQALGQGAWGAAQLGTLAYPTARGLGRLPLRALAADEWGAVPGFHGTPYQFDKFSTEAVGSGEGHQAFGWGHYIAENPAVAKNYMENVSKKRGVASGNVLDVHILPDSHEFLDLDKPLSQQSDAVKEAMKKLPWDAIDSALDNRNMNPMSEEMESYTGKHLYQALSHYDVHESLPAEVPGSSWYTGDTTEKKHTSFYLNSIGIPGLRYLDRGSRHPPFSAERIAQLRADVAEAQNRLDNYKVAPTPEEFQKTSAYMPSHYPLTYQNSLAIKSNFEKALGYAKERLETALGWKPTYNYVVFDPENIRIVGRNGEKLTPVDHDPFK